MHPLWKLLHLIPVAVWVGGMFFAYLCLRPVAAAQLEPPARLTLWSAVLARFFPWVAAAVVLILASGLTTLAGLARHDWPLSWHLMLLLGLLMSAIFGYVLAGPFRRLRSAVAARDWPAGGAALGRIRRWVGVNLALGLLTIAVASAGRLWG